jgi:hypothetical protein
MNRPVALVVLAAVALAHACDRVVDLTLQHDASVRSDALGIADAERVPDAGVSSDTGQIADAEVSPDTGPIADAGGFIPDAGGFIPDAAVGADAGVADTGHIPDAGGFIPEAAPGSDAAAGSNAVARSEAVGGREHQSRVR